MIVFVFLVSGIVENGAVPFFKDECVIFFGPDWFCQLESLFFGVRPIEN